MDERSCENCTNFYQHYGRREGKYYKVCCGHCGVKNPINKRYRKIGTVCEAYEVLLEATEKEKTRVKVEISLEHINRLLEDIEERLTNF